MSFSLGPARSGTASISSHPSTSGRGCTHPAVARAAPLMRSWGAAAGRSGGGGRARPAPAAARRAATPTAPPPPPAPPPLVVPAPTAAIPPLVGIPPTALPSHLALILDGNRRWARARGLPERAGYEAGVAALRTAVAACLAWGIPALTVFGFSTENWGRGPARAACVLGVAAAAARAHAPDLAAAGVRLRFIPRGLTRPRPLVQALADAEAMTGGGGGAPSPSPPALQLTVALSYSARADLGAAAAAIAADAAAGRLDPAAVTADTLAARLSTAAVLPPHLADPDLIVRTGGERRLSNFLLFEGAYAELAFVDALWPDVGVAELEGVVRDYAGRERRYGRG